MTRTNFNFAFGEEENLTGEGGAVTYHVAATARGSVREGDVPPPARAEDVANKFVLLAQLALTGGVILYIIHVHNDYVTLDIHPSLRVLALRK